MENQKRKPTVYEMLYRYKYMLETGYNFDEFARTVSDLYHRPTRSETEIKENKNENN